MKYDVTINNITELTTYIKELTLNTGNIWWYRGHADQSWKLQPGLWRGYSKEQESYMAHEFLFKARTRTDLFPSKEDISGWLSLMQHHGLPTRLLDWSKSPLIGLYFSVYNYHRHSINISDKDACIWLLCPGELNKYFRHEELIYPIDCNLVLTLINQAFYADQKKNLGVIAASAIETHRRMIMQQSAFTIHSEMKPLEEIDGNESWLRKVGIPQKALAEIAFELEILGIRLSNIFPDLDNLATEVRSVHK